MTIKPLNTPVEEIARGLKFVRFAFGRALVHFGLSIMPRSRARSELYQLFELWGTHVSKSVRTHLEREGGGNG